MIREPKSEASDAALAAVPADSASEPGLLSIAAFAAWAGGLGRSAIYEELKAGRLEGVKVGKLTKIPMESARAWKAALPRYAPAAAAA